MRSPAGSLSREARTRPREIRVENQPRDRVPDRAGFDAAPLALAARLGDAGVADEQQLRIELQRPQRRGQLQVRQHCGAQTDVCAERIDQRIDAVDRCHAIGRIDADRRAARVVAVKALADVEEEFRLAPGAEDQRELRADDRIVGAAGIHCEAAAHVEFELVRAQPELRPHGVAPARLQARIRRSSCSA